MYKVKVVLMLLKVRMSMMAIQTKHDKNVDEDDVGGQPKEGVG